MSATKRTRELRCRPEGAEIAKRLAEQHGRSQSDVVTAALRIARDNPAQIEAELAELKPLDRPRGAGGKFE